MLKSPISSGSTGTDEACMMAAILSRMIRAWASCAHRASQGCSETTLHSPKPCHHMTCMVRLPIWKELVALSTVASHVAIQCEPVALP